VGILVLQREEDVKIADNGSGIPDNELQTLDQGEETSLFHWLKK